MENNMNGFFFRILKRANNNTIKLFYLPYEEFAKLLTIEECGLYLFKHKNTQYIHSNGYTLYNIGTLIYKNFWNNKALELIAIELSSGKQIKHIMANTRGQFCLIIHIKDNVFFVTDKLGIIPIYKYENDNKIELSNLLLALAEQNKISINYQAVAEYLCFWYCFHSTFFNEIDLLEKGTVFKFGNETINEEYFNYLAGIQFNKYNNLKEISQDTKDRLQQNFSFLSNDDRIFTDITGGFDTRLLAIILKNLNLNFVGGICGDQVLNETNIAVQVAEKLNVEFRSNTKISDKNIFSTILDKHFNISNGVPILYHSTELVNYYEVISQDFDIHIMGLGGSELCDNFLPRLSFLTKRLKYSSLFEKYFKFHDIFSGNLITEDLYYNNITAKIANLLDKIGSDNHEKVASYLTASTISRYYHGSLMGTHDIIMPVYSPFLETNFAKIMIETTFNIKHNQNIQRTLITDLHKELSMLISSHGYNANISAEKHLGTKTALLNISRGLMYDFNFLLKFTRNIRRKKVYPIAPSDFQRSFWKDEILKQWKEDMMIFEIIDSQKLKKYIPFEPYPSQLNARILYLNRILEECVV